MKPSASERITVRLLGTGTPTPDLSRRGACQIISLGEDIVMVDCGAGALYRLLESKADTHSIKYICLTHLHSDHTTGILDFLWAGWVGRWWAKPPIIIGPTGTKQFIDRILLAFEEDIRLRSEEGATSRIGIVPDVIEVSNGWTLQNKRWSLSAIGVDHRPVKDALGFLFKLGSHRVVISGDTRKCDNLIHHSKGADLLVHEVIWGNGMKRLIAGAKMPQRARLERILSYHTPSIEVGEIAALASVKHLVLTHLVLAGGTPDDLISDVRRSFQGRVSVGKDLATYVA